MEFQSKSDWVKWQGNADNLDDLKKLEREASEALDKAMKNWRETNLKHLALRGMIDEIEAEQQELVNKPHLPQPREHKSPGK